MVKKMFMVKSTKERSYQSGYKKFIYLSAIDSGKSVQYDKDSPDLKQLIRLFGYGNIMTIMNQSSQDITVDLNYSTNNRYVVPAGNILSLTSVLYESFNIYNFDGATTNNNEVKILIGYEREPVKEWV